MVAAYTFELGKCYEENIRRRNLQVLAQVDQDLASAVAKGLGLEPPRPADTPEVTPSPALSQVGNEWPVDGRQIGILTTDETTAESVQPLIDAVFAAGMVPLVIAETGGGVASRTYQTARSIEFDAVVVVDAPDNVRADVLLSEVFRHQKAIALVGDVAPGQAPLDAAGVERVAEPTAALDALLPLLRTHRVWERSVD